MVTYIKSDLEFILEQIEIAEAHAAGQPLYGPGGLVPAYNLSSGLRTVDGSYNHLLPGQETWGAADTQFPELVDATFRPAQIDTNSPFVPGGLVDGSYAPSNDPNLWVVDSAPRTISNLIVDQTITNPAAVQRFVDAGLGVVDSGGVLHYFDDAAAGNLGGVVPEGVTLTIPNVAPDEGLSASFNSWFTLFGQFFDHGLDLVGKGESGTVFIPLQPDDPLITHGPDGIAGTGDEITNPSQQFMVLTRATVLSPGLDGVLRHARTIMHDRSTPRRRSSTKTRPTPRTPRIKCSCASTCSTPPAIRWPPASSSRAPTAAWPTGARSSSRRCCLASS